ncbi:nucleolar protein 11-like [Lineus longissimus]|uniref:nucleolar protein 11-like n=1 Tax=Lineus longissimus TaxID=88925 RepID=UPI002B4D7196
MAAISGSVNFCQFSSKVTDLVGIETAYDDDYVIISCRTRSVLLVNSADKKIVHNWSIKHGSSVTCPAVLGPSTSEYVTVQNDKSIRVFSKDTTLEKCKKFHASSPVHRILSNKGQDVAVVYQNGSVSSLGDVEQLSTTPRDGLVYCALTTAGKYAYVSTVHKKVDSTVEVVVNRKVGETYTEERTVTLERSGHILLATCEQCLEKRTNLLFLWSDGCLQSLPITDNIDQARILQHIPNITNNTSMIGIDSTHIALSAYHSKDAEKGIGIWDTKYGTLLAWKGYPEDCQTHKLYKHKNSLLMPCGKSVYQYHLEITPSTLSAALGSFTDSVNKTLEVSSQQPALSSWNLETEVGSSGSSEISQIMIDLKNASKANNSKKFTNALKRFLTKISKDDATHSMEVMNSAVEIWQYCIQGKDLWPSKQIIELVECKLVPSSMIDEICTAIIKRANASVVHTVIENIHDLPESLLVKALECYLRLNRDDKSEVKDSGLEDPDLVAKIDKVLSQPYSDVFLVEYLRKMDFQYVLMLLRYLYILLSGSKLFKNESELHLSRFQVVDWINLLLDAHFTQLVLSADAHTTLVKMHETVSAQVSLHDELVSLDALLSQLKEQCDIPQKKGVGMYSIEVLHVL